MLGFLRVNYQMILLSPRLQQRRGSRFPPQVDRTRAPESGNQETQRTAPAKSS